MLYCWYRLMISWFGIIKVPISAIMRLITMAILLSCCSPKLDFPLSSLLTPKYTPEKTSMKMIVFRNSAVPLLVGTVARPKRFIAWLSHCVFGKL